jgi:hypothetical protein
MKQKPRSRVNREWPKTVLGRAEDGVLSASLPSRGGWLILGELAIKGAWGEKLVGVSTEMAWGSHSSPIHSLISSRCSCLAWGLKAFVESIQAQPTRSARR